MNQELETFIKQARERNLSDDQIRSRLEQAGWESNEVTAALGDGLVVPVPPPHHGKHQTSEAPAHPMAVVENLTPRGFEYRIFSVSLVLGLFGLILVADAFMNGSVSEWVKFPLTLLIVTGPLALYMFLRLRRAELRDPSLRKDPSRRKVIQAVLLITFLAVLGHTIGIIYMALSGHYASHPASSYGYDYYSYNQPASLIADLLRWFVTLVVAGGTFVYFWRDEHRPS